MENLIRIWHNKSSYSLCLLCEDFLVTINQYTLVSTSKNRSGYKSSTPPFELSFGGDELWVISDARSLSMLDEDFIRNNPKFISTKWKFKWWRWTFVSTWFFEMETRVYYSITFAFVVVDFQNHINMNKNNYG